LLRAYDHYNFVPNGRLRLPFNFLTRFPVQFFEIDLIHYASLWWKA
jgi:hypothetical protein